MKNNFSNEQTLSVFSALGTKFFVRVNRAGNIDVVNPSRTNDEEHFVLYLTPNKRYMWRRWFDKYYCHPLNMVNRKRVGEIHYGTWNGQKFSYYNRSWDIKNCEFDTVDEAITYFKNYATKYHNVKF